MLLEHRESRCAPKKVLKARVCDVCFNIERRQERAAARAAAGIPDGPSNPLVFMYAELAETCMWIVSQGSRDGEEGCACVYECVCVCVYVCVYVLYVKI